MPGGRIGRAVAVGAGGEAIALPDTGPVVTDVGPDPLDTGLYYALTNPVLRAMVADTAPAEVRGRAFGIFYFVTSVAALLSSVATGELWKHFGAAMPLGISAGLATLAALLLFAMRIPRER